MEDTIHGHKIVDPYRWLENSEQSRHAAVCPTKNWPTRAAFSILFPDASKIQRASPSSIPSGPSVRRRSAESTTSIPGAKARRISRCLLVRERHSRQGSRSGRRQPDVRRRHCRSRLVVPFLRWQVCLLRNFSQRLRREHAARHRLRHRQTFAGHHRSHALRQRRMEERQLRLLLQPSSQKGRCPRRRRGLPRQDFLSRARQRSRERCARLRSLTVGRHTPQDIPSVQLPDDDDRWLLITVFEGWAKSELYLQDLKAGTPPLELTTRKRNFSTAARFYAENSTSPPTKMLPVFTSFVVDASTPQRENWKEIIPQNDAVLQNLGVTRRETVSCNTRTTPRRN